MWWRSLYDPAANVTDNTTETSHLQSPAIMPTTAASPYAASTSVNCEMCQKAFFGINRKYLLKRHMITHSGEKPFQCPYCDHRANIKQNMDVHIKRKHGIKC